MKLVNPVVTEIVGLQYGDEGKSKISSYESSDAKLIVRSTGGCSFNQAIDGKECKSKLKIIPSGIMNKNTICILGPGMAIDPQVLIHEIDLLRDLGVLISRQNLMISEKALVVLPYHKKLDAYYESLKPKPTNKALDGLESSYASNTRNVGVRMIDILHGNWYRIKEELQTLPQDFIDEYSQLYSTKREREVSIKALTEEMSALCQNYRLRLHFYIREVQSVINRILYSDLKIVVEGSGSYGLDIVKGENQFVLPFSCSSSSLISSAGIGLLNVKEIVGVAKAYNTITAKGPFITEVKGRTRKVFANFANENEIGLRAPKRYGWLDLVQLKNAVFENSITKLAITHIDTIGAIGNVLGSIKVCVGYKINEHTISYMPMDSENVKPIYQYLKPWIMPQEKCKTFDQLPREAKQFIHLIETLTCVNVSLIGTGPDKEDLIIR